MLAGTATRPGKLHKPKARKRTRLTLGLPDIIGGLAGDLRELREGKISVNDAIARAHLAKQIFNGFRIYLNASKMLSDNAKPARDISALRPPQGD